MSLVEDLEEEENLSSSSDVSVSDEEDLVEAPPAPSETRMIRELGEGVHDLVSTRRTPTRQPPSSTALPKIKKVNFIYNYGFVKPIPISEVETTKKEKRADRELVSPDVITVRPSVLLSYFLRL